jgi:hypothetical protein
VRHAHEHLQRLHDVTARGRLVQLAHEPDAARVAVAGGIEKTLRFFLTRSFDAISRERWVFATVREFRVVSNEGNDISRVPRGGGEREHVGRWVELGQRVRGRGFEVSRDASFLVAEGSPGVWRAPGCAVRGPSPPLARSRSGT